MTEGHKRKISKANKISLKRYFDNGGTKFWKGKKFSEEHKRKISEIKKRQWALGIRMGRKKGYKHSEEAKRKMSRTHKMRGTGKGQRSHFWKGGITPINLQIRMSVEYKLWREAVFKRDNYQCIWGGKEHGNKLNADHIKSFADYPELRLAIDNGRTLCIDCHRKTDSWGKKKNVL